MGRLTVLPITVAALSIFLLPACRDESAPTGPDRNVSVPESSPTSPGVGATPESPAAPELDCLALEERRVRFTDPGFSRGNRF